MSGRVRNKVGLIAAVAAAIALMVPATLALGEDDPIVTGDSSIVLLTLGDVDEITWDTSTQSVDLRNNCSVRLGSDPELLDIVGAPGALGHNKDGLGVRTGGSRGEPCGRTEADNGESISVSLGSDLSGYLMTAVDFDLELKFNAMVSVKYYRTGQANPVATDTFNPTSGSDDGPDSGDGDNYRYLHRPGGENSQIYFDTVVLTAMSGSFSLEGGADLGPVSDCTDEAPLYPCGDLDPVLNTSSQIEIVPTFDGQIDCGVPGATLGDEDVFGTVIMRAEDGPTFDWSTDAEICDLKPYNTSVTDDSISFMPALDGYIARYTFDVTVTNQLITTDGSGLITSLKAIYNEDGDLTFPDGGDGVEACNGTPLLDDSDSGVPGSIYDAYWTTSTLYVPGTTTPIMPTDESVCFYSASVSPTGMDGSDVIGTEEWSFLIFADPGIGFR